MKNNAGFTLVELLVTLVISLVIIGAAFVSFNSQQKQTLIQTNVSDTQQTLRAAMDFIARDIRMAGFTPDRDPTSSFGITDIRFRNLDDAVNATGNSFIRFNWDKDEDGVLDANETIDYSLVDSGTITPGTPDLYYRLPNDTNRRDVLGSNIIAFGLAFAYDADGDGELDQDGAGATIWGIDADNDNDWDSLTVDQAAGTAVVAETGTTLRTRDIRAVRIWLLGRSEAPDPAYRDTNTYVVGRSAIQPNNNFRHRLLERIVLCRNMGL